MTTPEQDLARLGERTLTIQEGVTKLGVEMDMLGKILNRIEQSLARGDEVFKQHTTDITQLKKQVAELDAYKNKFLGVIFLLGALSGVVGWLGNKIFETYELAHQNQSAIVHIEQEINKP